MKIPKELTTVTPLSRMVAVIVFIAIMIIGFGIGINYQETIDLLKQQNSSIQATIKKPPITNLDETANWKTYTNTKWKYQISYPPTWNVNENSTTEGLSITGENQKYFIGVDRWIDKERSPEEVARSFGMEFVFPDPKSVLKQSTFNIPEFYYVITGTDHRIAVIHLLDDKGSYIVIRTSIWPENESKRLFDQILSTFKFIK